MSSIFRIKENMDHYTDTEKRIAAYILEHSEDVVNYSSQLFAEKVNTSPAAIIRFSKKIGYTGFTNLKVELAKDSGNTVHDDFDSLIRSDDSIRDLVNKSALANARTFSNTYKLFNRKELEAVIQKLKKARRIYLLGIGGSALVALDFYHKLVRIDKDVHNYSDYHLTLSALSHVNEEDVLLCLSYSGLTREVVLAQKVALDHGATTVAITQVGKNDLSKSATHVLNIPKEESELRLGSIASRFSMLAITDLLYLGLAQDNIDSTRDKIIKTRETIKKIRD